MEKSSTNDGFSIVTFDYQGVTKKKSLGYHCCGIPNGMDVPMEGIWNGMS